MEAAATLCLLLRSKAEYSGSSSGTSLSLRLDLRSGPKVGRGGGRGDAPRSAGTGGRAEAASRNSTQSPPSRLHPRFFLQRDVGKSVGFVFVLFSFPAICQVLQPPRGLHRPPGTWILPGGGVRASPPPPRPEPTCPHPQAEPLRFALAGGQASSPAASSWVHSIVDLKG